MLEKPINFDKLERDFLNMKSSVLFVGTGIDLGAPNGLDFSWNALVNHLLDYAVNIILSHKDKYERVAKALGTLGITEDVFTQEVCMKFPRDVKTTIIKQTLGNASYVKLIQHFLYGQCTKKTLQDACAAYVRHLDGPASPIPPFHTLFRIADIILRSRNIRAVVTQNYDQFLYDAICQLQGNGDYICYIKNNGLAVNGEPRQIKPRCICDWSRRDDFSYDSLNIYHVHGFIPRYDEIQAPLDNKIVLSMDEFYEDSKRVYSWQIASQLHFLSQYTCVFCGLSMEDYTNQRLLHYVKNQHQGELYYISALVNSPYVSDDEMYIMDKIKNKFHEKNGLTVIYDRKGYNHIYQLIGELKNGN